MSNPDRINLNVLIEKTSLNSPERTGVYYVTGNNIGALPSGFSNYGILLCMRSPYSLHPTNSNCVYVQEYTDVYGKHASRSSNNGAWTNWVATATKDDYTCGTATIKANSGAVDISFPREFSDIPIVVTTVQGLSKDVLLTSKVYNINKDKFTVTVVLLNNEAVVSPSYDVTIDWIAMKKS